MVYQRILPGLKQAFRFMVLVGLLGNANFIMAEPQFIGILTMFCNNPNRTVALEFQKDYALIAGCVGCHSAANFKQGRTPLYTAYLRDRSSICPINVVAPPPNMPPTANANGPYTGIVGLAVMFSSAGSMDPNPGDILSFSWNFGDGATSTRPNPRHTYTAMGIYDVTLTVDDGNGGSATATTTADIGILPTPTPPPTANQAPVLDMIGDWNMKVDDELNIPLSATDAEGDALAYDEIGLPADFMLMDNGDGTGSISGMAMMPGKYDVTVTVREISTAEMLSNAETFTITITDNTAVIPTYTIKKVKAKWKRNRKILKVKGKLKPTEPMEDEDDDMCSAMEGIKVSITNADGKEMFDTTVNCKGKFKAGKKIQSSLMSSCEITVSAGASVEPMTIRVRGCKRVKDQNRGRRNRDDDDDDKDDD